MSAGFLGNLRGGQACEGSKALELPPLRAIRLVSEHDEFFPPIDCFWRGFDPLR